MHISRKKINNYAKIIKIHIQLPFLLSHLPFRIHSFIPSTFFRVVAFFLTHFFLLLPLFPFFLLSTFIAFNFLLVAAKKETERTELSQ
jgi:hypothetical protein